MKKMLSVILSMNLTLIAAGLAVYESPLAIFVGGLSMASWVMYAYMPEEEK